MKIIVDAYLEHPGIYQLMNVEQRLYFDSLVDMVKGRLNVLKPQIEAEEAVAANPDLVTVIISVMEDRPYVVAVGYSESLAIKIEDSFSLSDFDYYGQKLRMIIRGFRN